MRGHPAHLALRASLLLAWVCAPACVGCGARPSRLLQSGQRFALTRPYENTFFVEQPPRAVLHALSTVLDDTGAMVIASDGSGAMLAWCDRSGMFHPLIFADQSDPATLSTSPVFSRQLHAFHGVVYGAARLEPSGRGTLLRLHATRRDERPWILTYSNGDYERYIHRQVSARSRRAVGTAWPSAAEDNTRPSAAFSGSVTGASDPNRFQPMATYGSLYLTHFDAVDVPKADRIRAVGLHKLYPVPVEQFWQACLNVVWQYDAVVKLDNASRIVVFSHGMALPAEDRSANRAGRYCNALIAVLAEARGAGGTDVYIVWLPPGKLNPTSIEALGEGALTMASEELLKQAHRLTATRVATQLLIHIPAQLFWRERWLPKLSRRQPSGEANLRNEPDR